MKKLNLIALFILILAGTLKSQTIPAQIDSIVNSYYSRGEFNGNVLIADDNNILYSKSYGFSNAEQKIQNTIDTKFMIGSCTKQFTAALIMLLNEEGKLNLTDKISKYIPDYPSKQGDKITIHHLLTHTSGIPDYVELPAIQKFMFTENKPMDIIQNFWNLDLEFESGAKYKYSNSGYFVLGKIIENITGKTYEEVLKDKIFNPLEMNNSGYYSNAAPPKNMATGYITKDDSVQLAPPVNATAAYAAGGLYSTLADLRKWENALISNTLLSKESLALMTTPHTKHYGYGLGLVTLPTNGKKVSLWGHEGEFFGYRSLIHVLDNGKFLIVLLDNHENTGLMKIANEIRNTLYANE